MSKQGRLWKGRFGKQYTNRNIIDWKTHLQVLGIISGLEIDKVLEIGCNRGHNLTALDCLGTTPYGIDLNQYALQLAPSNTACADASSIPFKDNSFDLVLTMGVLIHIPPVLLGGVLSEIYRVSSQYILLIEYWAPEDTPIIYQTKSDMLWKRNFPEHIISLHPDLVVVRNGRWGYDDKFYDKLHGWLFEKERVNA